MAFGQTAGFNYQALILNNEVIQIPGTDVNRPSTPLISEEIIIRFTVSNENNIEYIEEHQVFTDEFGMISLIVGDGTPDESDFSNIIWDGKVKYLNVELKVLDKDDEFTLIDSQKILHIPGPGSVINNTTSGYGNIKIYNTVQDIQPPFTKGDLVWVTNYGENNNTTLLIWGGEGWIPVNEDYDNENEFSLIVVPDKSARSSIYPNPEEGDVVWNKLCQCIEVYDNNSWLSITTRASNGITLTNGNAKLGGKLTEPTILETSKENSLAVKGLQLDTQQNNNVVVVDNNTGVLKQTPVDFLNIKAQSKEIIVFANDGQLEFSTPLTITSSSKINVYRNGVNISFEVLNNKTIKLEPEAICYKNDKIRIVQLY